MNNHDRAFKGVWIPKDIYLGEDLSWTEKILLVEINSLDHGEGCWASNEYFAEFLGKSEGQIANIITDLRKKGYVEDVKFDGRKRYIKALGFSKTGKQGSGKPEGWVQENLNENEEKIPQDSSTEPLKEHSETPNNTVNNTIKLAEDKSSSSLMGNSDEEPPEDEDTTDSDLTFEEYMGEAGYFLREFTNPDGDIATMWASKATHNRVLSQGKINSLNLEYRKQFKGVETKKYQKPTFDSDSEIIKLSRSVILTNKILALFFMAKKFKFDNFMQMQAQVDRYRSSASKLKGYTSAQLKEVMEHCEEDSVRMNYDWGLETVIKKASAVINTNQ